MTLEERMERLRRAVHNLETLRDAKMTEALDPGNRVAVLTVVRLSGKIEGVKLALSYLEEETR